MMRLMVSARKQTGAIALHQRGRKDPAAGVIFPPASARRRISHPSMQ
jgi:hypothetical protein